MNQHELEYIERMAQMPLSCRIISLENSSPHWHYEYEAFFVLRGAVTVHDESTTERLGAGDIFLFNPVEIHSINQSEQGNLCLVLQFSPDAYDDVYKANFRFELNTRKGLPDNAVNIFRQNLAGIGLLLHEKPNGYQFYVKSHLYGFIGSMFRYLRYQVEHAAEQPDSLEDFDRVKKYIKQRFAEEINQAQLCRDLAVSRATLYRLLKRAGASSYKVLVNYYRIEHAKGMLRNSQTPIPVIVSESGFESESSFYRIFRRLTGVTPSQYRNAPQSNIAPFGVQGYVGFAESEAIAILRDIYAR